MRLLEFLRPFRIVASRRVSEEEQVSVEAFCKTPEQTKDRLENILETFRDHRKRSNAEVVAATRQQLSALDTAIEHRGDTIRELDTKIEEAHAELRRLEDIAAQKAKKLSPGASVADLRRGNGAAGA